MKGPRRVLTLIGWGIGVYAVLVVLAWAGQDRLLYPAPSGAATPELDGAALERIEGPERTVYALHVAAPAGAPTLVHFHGNGEDLSDQVGLASLFRERGLGFFAVEYPGYGLARDEQASEPAIYAAAEAAIGRLRELGVEKQATVLTGISLGSGVAAEMALRGHGARLILITPYTSMVDLARRITPFLPVSLLLRHRFDTSDKAAKLDLPALIIHGTDDEVIPVAMGKELSERLPRARLLLVTGGRHNDLFATHTTLVVDEIERFSRDRDR